MSIKDKDSPATTSVNYDNMVDIWDKIDTLLGGTEAMREASSTYLPSHEMETTDQYNERLTKAVLFNFTDITLGQWVGRPFSDKLKIDEKMPEDIKNVLENNVDQMGNNINVFSRNWFKMGLAKAFAHAYVDMPRSEVGGVRSVADDKTLLPYMTFIQPETLFFAHAIVIDGQEILTQIRLHESISIMDGFEEVIVPRIRVITRMLDEETFEPFLITDIYEEQDDKWEIVETFSVNFPVIPLVTFYADRTGLLQGKPPILDLANININHWQSNSDHDVILTVAQFPILAASGVDEDTTIKIGPKELLTTEDPQGKFYYIEHTGKAIAAGAARLKELEEQMSNYGAEFLKKRPGSDTATARALDSSEATSPLQDATMRFNDALNTALGFMAMWVGRDPKEMGVLELITDFGPEEAEQAYLQEIGKGRERRDLSRKRWVAEMQRNGGLAEDFDDEQNQKELETEAANEINGDTDVDIDPDAPPVDDRDEDTNEE